MAIYRLTATCECVEVYAIEADSEEEARAKFERGDVLDPESSEVTSVEDVKVEPYEGDGIERPRKVRR
jgi:hypothetical protein